MTDFRSIRDALGLSQNEMAVRAGVSTNTIIDLELGRESNRHGQTRRALAEAYGVDIADIPGRRPEPAADGAEAAVISSP